MVIVVISYLLRHFHIEIPSILMFVSWFQHSFDMFYHTVLTWFDFEILWPMCISLYLNVKKWRTRVPQKYWHLICTNNYQQFPRMVFDFGFGSKLWVRIGTAQLLSQVYNQIKHVVRLRQIVERCNRPDQGHTYWIHIRSQSGLQTSTKTAG